MDIYDPIPGRAWKVLRPISGDNSHTETKNTSIKDVDDLKIYRQEYLLFGYVSSPSHHPAPAANGACTVIGKISLNCPLNPEALVGDRSQRA